MKQKTISRAVEVIGIGLHKGEPVKLRLEPLNEDSGIIFYRSDIALSIPLDINNVIDTRMATVIGSEKGSISTIEHFLSAIYAYGIDNIRVIVDSSEMPAMDGSAISYCILLNEAGIKEQSKNKKILKIKKEVIVKDGEKFVKLKPSSKPIFDFKIDFSHPVIGSQKYKFNFNKLSFINEIARARTFGFAKDIQYLQSQGLALGASLNNAIGLDDHKILNPEGLRFENEFVRHKILDAMGDLRISQYNVLGEYQAFAGSHKLNYELNKKVFSDSKNYEIIEIKTEDFFFEMERAYSL